MDQMKVKDSFVNEYMCLCVPTLRVRVRRQFRSRSAKENGSTWVMTCNTASWLSDRLTRCRSLFVCPFVFLILSARLSF